jgi:hypothetical protein
MGWGVEGLSEFRRRRIGLAGRIVGEQVRSIQGESGGLVYCFCVLVAFGGKEKGLGEARLV